MKKILNNKISNLIKVLIAVLALFLFNIDGVKAAVSWDQNFDYTGGIQSVTIPYSGVYNLQTWAASGGSANGSQIGGYGGYSTGKAIFKKGDVIYVGVGGAGSCVSNRGGYRAGGYNGGGNAYTYRGNGYTSCSGGGATHIATTSGLLSQLSGNTGSILIVSGGGGGASYRSANDQYGANTGYFSGGHGGGIQGNNSSGTSSWSIRVSTGGTQSGGGQGGTLNNDSGWQYGSFGTGAQYNNAELGGGGGGWYGGGSGNGTGGGGGSGYIGNSLLLSTGGTTKHMTCYNCTTNGGATTLTYSNTCVNGGAVADCSKTGNGYAKITLAEAYTLLNNLTVKKGSLTETFKGDKFNYTWIIPKGVDELTDDDVEAVANHPDSTVIIPQSVPFEQDGDTFVIQVITDDLERITYTLTMQRFVSSDARISSLTADKGVFRQAFDPETTNYTLEIFEDAESVTLDAEAFEQDNQGISGIGEITLDSHEKDVDITSTAEDGTIKVYKVHIIKNMYLENIEIEGIKQEDCEEGQCALQPEFNKEKENYTIYVPIDYYNLNVSYVPSDEDLTVGVRVNEVSYLPGYKLQKIKNVVRFNIYNDDDSIVKTYTVTVVRDNKESGKIKNLKVNKGRLLENFHKNKYEYSWVIPKDVNNLTKNDVAVTLFNTTSVADIPENVTFVEDGDKFIINVRVKEEVAFNYTGNIQTFIAPYDGLYKLETWGASGGDANGSYIGGYGSYSTGITNLSFGDELYIGVGGAGTCTSARQTNAPGGYNGGGIAGVWRTDTGFTECSGGGATHIALGNNRGILSNYNSYRNEVLMVAGGGGGASYSTGNFAYFSGGSAGGYQGNNSSGSSNRWSVRYSTGGNQSAGGTGGYLNNDHGERNGSFGTANLGQFHGAGGGGGWFGGGSGSGAAAGGGSGYIANSQLISAEGVTKHMTGNRVATSTTDSIRTNATTCASGSAVADCSKDGHGYAKITLLEAESITKTYTLTMQREISDDARLATLTSDKGIFTEEFDKDKDEYVLEMYHKETKVSFDATPFEQDAEVIDGLGEVDLPTDETEHHITVQAENGTIKVYTVIIRRNMYLEDLGLNGLEGLSCKSYECNMIPSFSPEIIYYEYRVPLDYTILDVFYEPASAEHRSEMTINGEPYVDGYVLPYTGVTTVKVHVYNDDDEIVKTYTMNVIKKYEEIEEFEYTGNYQTFKAPRTGKYYMQTWGASGGDVLDLADDGLTGHASGGRGGYSSGYVELNKDEIVYIYVGGQGSGKNQVGTATGGYNGGGDGYLRTTNTYRQVSSGGGATDIRLVSGPWNNTSSLASRIMVAGGGGGAHQNNNSVNNLSMIDGGVGGTLTGGSGVFKANGGFSTITPTGGTQTYGGQSAGGANAADWQSSTYTSAYIGSFGQGASISNPPSDTTSAAGGGGGYYGGATGVWKSGGGGSSFISGHTGSVAVTTEDDLAPKDGCANGTDDIECSYHYSGKIFTDTVMRAGNETIPTHDNEDTMTGNTGDGYAKIKLEETETMLASLDVDGITLVEPFDKFRTEYTWIIPKGVEEFTSDNIEAVLLHPDKAHIEWPSEPVHFNENGDKFTFKVVADNGEEDIYTLIMERYKSDDARLKSLTSNIGTFNKEFDPDDNSYIINVYEDVDKIILDAETIDPDATISGELGEIELDENEVTTEILVTAEDGTINVYTVTIRKNAYLLYLGLVDLDTMPCVEDECILVPPFAPESNEYNIKVPYEYANIDVYYLLASDEYTAQVKLNGNVYTDGASLPVGESTVVVDIYNTNNEKVNTYTMIVNRQKGNYATLENLEVSIGDLDIPFDKNTTEYTWIIPYDTEEVLDDYITYEKTDLAATVSMPESVTYTQDGDEFNIIVTAEDGVTTKTYKLILQRDIIEDIEVNEEMVIAVGELKNLYVNGLPDGCAGKFLYEIDQNAIAVVFDNGDVYGMFPGDATVTISVKNHPEITPKVVHVTVVSDKITSSILDVTDKDLARIIIGEEPGVNISDFLDKLDNPREYLEVYDKDDNLISSDDYENINVKTGIKVKLVINDVLHDEAIIIIRGDINEDGLVNVIDKSLLSEHVLRLNNIEGYRTYAADVDNNDSINVVDKSKISEYLLRLIDSLNE